ncbi:RNA repair transcriptional activator RtcR [Pleionea sediminis]|uniref:RNA repair transcriptional activator RtcR n=1 Tax=Pleionea sediminis TaxID=2569479 RepID=UPI001186EEE6|nr:RNA repair transcriptional activator RtcR [Pleionea sediminis]
MTKTIAISILGTQLDYAGKRGDRWSKWRPNVSLCSQSDLVIDELYLLHDERSQRLANTTIQDIAEISPETKVHDTLLSFEDPWDFEEVYSKLFDLCDSINFNTEKTDYLFHITTGTHVAQICIFLLTESRHFPGRLVQTSPGRGEEKVVGKHQIIDLDLSRYDQIASRFTQQQSDDESFLKGGIATQNEKFNQLITQIEKVAIRSSAPILLNGPTGAGKTQLARRIYALKKKRDLVSGDLVAVNCATLKGDSAMSALFGHNKGAFTGAQTKRAGFLLSADKGVLFLDEIGELGLDEQAMLLHALETKTFFPVGSDKEVKSDFQLIAGTNKDLNKLVAEGSFREDLLARINLWTYELPGLKDRREDIEPNIEFELQQFARNEGKKVDFNREARERFLAFALSHESTWQGNFRDLNATITRMCTLAESARISLEDVKLETERLNKQWSPIKSSNDDVDLNFYLSKAQISELDNFDKAQLKYVIATCLRHRSMASAGRELFDQSRLKKTKANDSNRLQKYLAKFELTFDQIKGELN